MKTLQITAYNYPYLSEKLKELDITYDQSLDNIDADLWDINMTSLGKGQYKIQVIFKINNKPLTLSVHSTDSELYDMKSGEEKYSRIYDRVIDEDSWSIIQDFIEHNFNV